ncbi:MAG: replicative DNA helicase [Acidimicrobiia bacterium]
MTGTISDSYSTSKQNSSRETNRQMPHNIIAEECLIGSMLLNRDAISSAIEMRVEENDYYKPAHSEIHRAIMAMYNRGEAVDEVTLMEQLRRDNAVDKVGGKSAILELQAAPPSSTNATYYAKIITDLSQLRAMIIAANDIAEMGYSNPESIPMTLDRAETMIFDVAERQVTDSLVTSRDSVNAAMNHLEEMYGKTDDVTGVSTGYYDLDELLLGLQPNALYILAARPAMGKTAASLGIASNVALTSKKPTLIFSMEMGHLELTKRLLSAEARVPFRDLQTGKVSTDDWEKLGHAVGRLADAPIFIDDNPHCTIMEMRAKARRIRARHGELGAIVIDYLQLMSSNGSTESRQLEVSEMSRGLKILARELEVPVIALSQLNRQLEYRQDKRPMLADLRESGSLEQDADVVMFLYRDEVYNPDSESKGVCEIIVGKNRNGPTGTVRLAFLDKFTKFANIARGS